MILVDVNDTESGCVWITTDRDFARFPGLQWMHPLEHHNALKNPE